MALVEPSLSIKAIIQDMKDYRNLLRLGEIAFIDKLFNRISRVKSGRGLINWFNRLVDLIFGGRRQSMTRVTVVFVRDLFRLRSCMGIRGLVLYLKACHVITMQAAGGMKIRSTRPLKVAVARSSDGFPRIIPAVHRRNIRNGDRRTLRLWLSLFSVYRILSFKSMASLKTITLPGVPGLETKFSGSIRRFCQAFSLAPGSLQRELKGSPIKTMIYKSSPTTAGLAKDLNT